MIKYKYKNFKIEQERVFNYVTITIYEGSKVVFMSHSKRFIDKEEGIKFIKNFITKLYKEGVTT